MVAKPVEVQRESQPARAHLSGSGGLALAAPEQENAQSGQNHHRSGGKKLTTDTQMETVKMHQVNCLIEDAVMQKLDRCKALLSGKHPCGIDYNTLIMELASDWLEKHDPVSRSERRTKRKKSKNTRTTSKLKNIDQQDTSRHISPATRDAVYSRDGGQCSYRGSNGKRCESKWDLEIHHDQTPFAMGGGHSLRNLRLLCAVHNKLEAELVYGQRHMRRYQKQQE
jgi:5-methylcytosine-specific restriction endonuclease McrA